MVMTARHAGAPQGSGGAVMVWSRVCAWVRVYLEAGDGPGLRAPGVERHGRQGEVQQRAGRDREGLTIGVDGDRVAMQWRFEAV